MSKKSGGIGLGSLFFWGWLCYVIFGSDGDDKEKKVEKPKEESAISIQTKQALEFIKKDAKQAIEYAKKDLKQSFDQIKEKVNEKKEKVNEEKEFVKEKESIKEKEDELLVIDKKPKVKPESTFKKL